MSVTKIAKVAKVATAKVATAKASKAKKVTAPIVENIVPVASRAEVIVAMLNAKLITRVTALKDNGINVPNEVKNVADNFSVTGKAYREFLIAIERTESVFSYAFLQDTIGNYKTTKGNSDSNYIQFKTIEKVLKFIKAVAYKDFRMLDNHTRNITFNTMYNQGVISNKGAFASLVRVEFDALESQDETIKYRANYSTGTGSSQLSSTKELFRIVGLTEGVKGKRDAAIVFTPEAKVALTQHFEVIEKATA